MTQEQFDAIQAQLQSSDPSTRSHGLYALLKSIEDLLADDLATDGDAFSLLDSLLSLLGTYIKTI